MRVLQAPEVEDPLLLKALGHMALARSAAPRVCVTADALELSALTGEELDALRPGRRCRIPLPDLADAWGDGVEGPIVRVEWPDLVTRPQAVRVTVSNRPPTLTGGAEGYGRLR